MDLKNIKAFGFDLDHTLYAETPETQHLVKTRIYQAIVSRLPLSLEEATKRYEETYARLESSGRAMVEIGILDGRELLRDCLRDADISSVLPPDQKLVALIQKLKDSRRFLFLATESRQADALKKLKALGIDSSVFDFAAYWDSTELKKDTGTIYPHLLALTGYSPGQHCYCGNSLNDDIRPAKKFGFKTVLVGSTSDEADLCIPKIHTLEDYLG